VLTPSHSSLREYKTKNLNCKVIQFFEFNPKEIPEYKNIIIDEIGMCSSHACALISKWALLGKRIFGFGDFKQLTPVNSKVQNGEIYLNWVFNDITKLGTNYRNDFTYDFYDSLINCNDVKKSTDVVKKYNTDFYKADAIICYKNTTRQKYNNLILKKIGLKHGDKGEMVQCKTNKLASKNIFNNFIFKVINNIGDDVILSDDYDNYTITQKDFFDYFEPAYCRTIYNIQGESIKSIHYCMDDIQFLKGNVLYTVISRIKNK
jgi:ATP-dependent exoDNAse (exonuclease V) alpha subunit